MCANEARADRRSAGRDEGTLQVIFNHAVVRSLSPSNEMAKVVYSAGIDHVSGALSKPGKSGQHSCEKMLLATHRTAATTSKDCNRIYLRTPVKRTSPLSQREFENRAKFMVVSGMIKARKADLMKITTDQQNFLAQKNDPDGAKTMKAYYWKICGAEYDEQHS